MPSRVLRCVIDANIFLSAIRYRGLGDERHERDPAYALLESYRRRSFTWVYSPAILDEYRYTFQWLKRGVVTSSDKRSFDTKTFDGVMALIQLGPGLVEPTEEEEQHAYDAIMNETRPEHLRDPDDYIYLAAAENARKHEAEAIILVGSEDSDLYQLRQYKEIPILRLRDLLAKIGASPTS